MLPRKREGRVRFEETKDDEREEEHLDHGDHLGEVKLDQLGQVIHFGPYWLLV